ncbi:hypothetical protein F5Y14DRAFT_398843 [Nemania sp. NC0429]|nr:hypothetical protein F5Y14DRAFT_398843 [Nemania sp. NC0429]
MDNTLNNDWDLDKFDPAAASTRVRRFHLCALRDRLANGDVVDPPPLMNHWALSLETSLRSSVMFDLVFGHGGDKEELRGKIEVTSLSERYARETLRLFSFEPMGEVQVGRVMALMQGKDFAFSHELEARRHWLSELMGDLEAASCIPQGGAVVAREALSKYWGEPEGPELKQV